MPASYVREHPADGASTRRTAPVINGSPTGAYLFKGTDEPLEVFEVGDEASRRCRCRPTARRPAAPSPSTRRKRWAGVRPSAWKSPAARTGIWSANSAKAVSAKSGWRAQSPRLARAPRLQVLLRRRAAAKLQARADAVPPAARGAGRPRRTSPGCYEVQARRAAVLPGKRIHRRRQPARLGRSARAASPTLPLATRLEIVAKVGRRRGRGAFASACCTRTSSPATF